MPLEVVELLSESRPISKVDGELGFIHSFFKKRIGKPAIIEAWKRSENFNLTRIKDRSLFFLCLITGEANINRAKEAGGYSNSDMRCNLIFESSDETAIELLKNFKLIPYPNDADEGKRFYFEMTMVELELIHK
ncbi:MAG: hypothetical protein M1597_02495 [Candidatus Thermoplasmatota archaeon]|nr:hypothetical protein [Candidatus Thermoplasmatota archaeon]